MTKVIEEENIIIKKSEQITDNISVTLSSVTNFSKEYVSYIITIDHYTKGELKKIEFVPSEWMTPDMFMKKAIELAKKLDKDEARKITD